MAQRGADMGIFRSSETSEYAAAEFLKWFTDPERNIEFTASIGYIPVENEALSSIEALENFIQMSDNTDAVKKSVTAALEAMQEGKFFVRRPFENSYEANERFSRSLERKTASKGGVPMAWTQVCCQYDGSYAGFLTCVFENYVNQEEPV